MGKHHVHLNITHRSQLLIIQIFYKAGKSVNSLQQIFSCLKVAAKDAVNVCERSTGVQKEEYGGS